MSLLNSGFNFLKLGDNSNDSRTHFVQIANYLAVVLSILAFFLIIILWSLFGWTPANSMTLVIILLYIGSIGLNRIGYDGAGRLTLCMTTIWFPLFISVYGKIADPTQSYIGYIDVRFILLMSTLLPAIVLDIREKVKTIVCLSSSFIALMLFDPIHNAFGVGYYQRGFDLPSYYYLNYVAFITFLGMVIAIFVLKIRDQMAAQRLRELVLDKENVNEQLLARNNQLQAVSAELEAQNEEMLQQQEELHANHEKLEEANNLIRSQQERLVAYNLSLEKLVEEKAADLLKANEELIKSNNELRQFSFTVSHNLRGPVARLLGLTNLARQSKDNNEILLMTEYIHQSASELDNILKDLTHIIDIRNELYRVKEKISIRKEWERSVTLMGEQVKDITIQTDFSGAPFVYGIRPMVQSIFYNLLTNSIKYKDPEKKTLISLRSYSSPPEDNVVFEITDNGLGMNMERDGKNLFKLYSRFHQHVAGRGMGLYLVKSQVEIMGGKIEVSSAEGVGTTFKVTFKIPENLSKQVFYDNESAQLYYDAFINNTVIIWKKDITSDEYRAAFQAMLHSLQTYKTPGWIADVRRQGVVSPEDQNWFITTVLQVAAANGLSRIGTVGLTDPIRQDYLERMTRVTGELGITFRHFKSIEEAVEWMMNSTTNIG